MLYFWNMGFHIPKIWHTQNQLAKKVAFFKSFFMMLHFKYFGFKSVGSLVSVGNLEYWFPILVRSLQLDCIAIYVRRTIAQDTFCI